MNDEILNPEGEETPTPSETPAEEAPTESIPAEEVVTE